MPGRLSFAGPSFLDNWIETTTTMSEPVTTEFEMLALFEMTPDLVCIAGKDGYFKKVNPAVISTLQYEPEIIYSRLISSFIHPDDRELTSRERTRLLEGKTLLNFQNRYLTSQGETVWLEWTSLYLPEKEIVFAIAKNITANKRKEEDFAGKISTYKNLAHHFKNRAEEDRKWLAYELHEDVAQLAVSLKWQTDMIQHAITGLPNEISSKLKEIISISDSLVKSIQRISFSISPAMIDDLGFNETMECVCREFIALTGINCDFYCDWIDVELSRQIKTDVFRACQELLLIIGEQENISSVSIRLEKSGDNILMDIEIDGNGVGPVEALVNIQQLATSMNARLMVTDEYGKGTKITMVVENDY